MINDYLIPVSNSLKELAVDNNDLFSIGKKISFKFEEESSSNRIILIGIYSSSIALDALGDFRNDFYKLRFGNWHSRIFDLGNLQIGNTDEDTLFAIKEIYNYFLPQKNTRIILIGDQTKQINWQHFCLNDADPLKITNIDSKIALGNTNLPLNSENYLGKLLESRLKIYDYNHMGYQSYYVSYKELELLDQLNFNHYRLGEVYEKVEYFSPTLQYSNSVSINLESIANYSTGLTKNANGFSNREICNLAYYSGLSSELAVFGLYNYSLQDKNSLKDDIISQLVWYFIEGFNNKQEQNHKINGEVEKYILPFQDKKIEFNKNKINNKWWVIVGEKPNVFPCSKEDYQEAVNNNITKRIKSYLKKTQ